MINPFFYSDINNNLLLEILQDPEFASALGYQVEYRNYSDLIVTPRDYSIEISKSEITIVIILYSGFELNEYLELKNRINLNLISLSKIILEMCEFENMHIKYIDKLAWLFAILDRSDFEIIRKVNRLKNLQIN